MKTIRPFRFLNSDKVFRSGLFFHRKSSKFSILQLVSIAICVFGQSADAQTSIYVFDPNQSTVLQTGGIAGVHETYPLQGQFQLTADANAGVASFDYVDAFLLSPISSSPPKSLGELFNMTQLAGMVTSDTTLEFTGRTANGSSVLINLTFADEIVTMKAQTTPPPNSADFFIFSMDAVAKKKYAGGTGEPNNPYHISTAEDLMLLGETPEDYDKHFKLMADIDLDPNLSDGKVFTNALIASDPIYPCRLNTDTLFTGSFNGNGYSIWPAPQKLYHLK